MNKDFNLILTDDSSWSNLLPLTYTRPIAELRVGILKIKEKWEKLLRCNASFLTQDYLSKKFPVKYSQQNLYINGSIVPDENLVKQILNLNENEILLSGDIVIAILTEEKLKPGYKSNDLSCKVLQYKSEFTRINYPWDIFRLTGQEIAADFKLITNGRKSLGLNKTNQLLGEENIFIEDGVKADYVTLNATTGPIYLGKNSEIMEGSVVRGPFALCEDSTLKLVTKIYGPTTIGPHCKVGGEVNNSVIQGYSNKAHDGFLGNSVLGEWCNLGADTNNSNLKNNYAEVKLWNYPAERFVKTGLQFCGLIMGDHSKCGINTMFNTGTVVGVSANIYGSGFPRNFIPSYSWGGAGGMTVFTIDKAFEVAEKVMERRGISLDDIEKEILTEIFNRTEKYRKNF
ncbi:MAG: GlmU family protein [Bacteroidales bacterium]|nr:GlmU family protein [Bacteroidales bacterium]